MRRCALVVVGLMLAVRPWHRNFAPVFPDKSPIHWRDSPGRVMVTSLERNTSFRSVSNQAGR